MILTKQKYTIDDLYKNMRVRVSQLSGILDTCMILLDTVLLADNDVEGALVYFGSRNTEKYTKWFQQEKAITPVVLVGNRCRFGLGKEEISCVKWQSTYLMKFCLIQK